jgi:hypothetical protein
MERRYSNLYKSDDNGYNFNSNCDINILFNKLVNKKKPLTQVLV